ELPSPAPRESRSQAAVPPPAAPPVPPGLEERMVTPAPAPATPRTEAASAAPEARSEDQVAMAPVAAGQAMQLSFRPGSSALTNEAESKLNALAAQMRGSEARLQLLAYASAEDDNAGRARRTSLSRALAVRSHLIEAGI